MSYPVIPQATPGSPGSVPDAVPVEALLRRPNSPLAWAAMLTLGLGGLGLSLVVVLWGGPVAALICTLLAAVSFPLVIAVSFWVDRYEPEPGRYRLAALGWGAVVAVGISVVGERLIFAVPGTTEFVDAAISAPLVEEAAKGLFLVSIMLLRRAQLHGVLDGIVYATLVGVGFAFVEDIVYYLGTLTEDGADSLAAIFLLRGVMGPFAHPLFTSATGIGIGLAVTSRRPAVRWLAPPAGFLVAVALHGLWNGSTFGGSDAYFTAYLGVMLPMLTGVLALAAWARYREGILLTGALQQLAAYGWVRPEDIRWVAQLSDRMSARRFAKVHGGPRAARAVRAYQQTMTEMAFLHVRASSGTAPADVNDRMQALRQRSVALAPYMILPPPALR